MALKTAAAAALLALLLPAVVARSLFQTDLSSLKEQCTADSDVPAGAYTEAQCNECVEQLGGASRLQSIWGCFDQVCQAAGIWESQSADDFECTDCLLEHDPETCLSCATNVPASPRLGSALRDDSRWGTADEATVIAEARAYCLACMDAPSVADASAAYPRYPGSLPGFQTASAGQGKEAEYRAACSACANLPATAEGDAARLWCAQCMSSTFAKSRRLPGGYLTSDEIAQLVEDKGGPLLPSDYSLTDFGKCAYIANHTYTVSVGGAAPTGIYSMCAWQTQDFPFPAPTTDVSYGIDSATVIGECVDCINAVVDNSSKAYACGLCRNPDWTENDADVATECFECVENANVSEPWGCTNCFSLESKDTFDTFSREECVACVTANPYEDKVGTYNWACGECAAIGSAMIRELCQQCINMPALDSLAAGTLADDLLSVAWVGNATEIICSCVDMVKDSTWGENAPGLLSDWYSFECPNCTAIQKMCYMRRNITWPSTAAPDPRPTFIAIPLDGNGQPLQEGPSAQSGGYAEADLCNPSSADWAEWATQTELMWDLYTVLSENSCLTGAAASAGNAQTAIAALDNACTNTGSADLGCKLLAITSPALGYVLFHLDDFVSDANETGFSCVQCMRNFSTDGQDRYMYACDAYCMNPYTMRNSAQIDQCYSCLERKGGADVPLLPGVANDVAGCEQCIQAFTGTYPLVSASFQDYDLAKRGACMDCLLWETSFSENRDWACVACGQLSGPSADACYECLQDNVLDPCQCVDGWKRGWLCYEPTDRCVVDAAGIAALLDDDDDSPGLDGGYEALPAALSSSEDACADVAQAHGADLFALVGSTCYYFQGNLQYLNETALAFLGSSVTGTCPANQDAVVQQVGGCPQVPEVQSPVPCVCSGDATCTVDDDAPTCVAVPTPFLAPWQRRCECPASQTYVEGVGCEPAAAMIAEPSVARLDGTNADAECVIGKKLAFCLNDRGTYGADAVTSGGPFSVLTSAMFGSSSRLLNLLYADNGIGSDAKAYDLVSPGGRRTGWSLTANSDADVESEIKYRNNRDNGNVDWPTYCTPGTACTNYFNVRGSVASASGPAGAKVLTWTADTTADGIDMALSVTFPGADAESLYHEVTITNNGGANLTDVNFVWTLDPDQTYFGPDRSYDSEFAIFNSNPLSQVVALDGTTERLPAILFTSCNEFAEAGAIFQNRAPNDFSFADTYVGLASRHAELPSEGATSGNFALYMLFKVPALAVNKAVTLTWTVGFVSDAVARSTSAYDINGLF